MQKSTSNDRIATGESGIRDSLREAAKRWREVSLKPDPELSRDQRIKVRAYAEAYGIAYSDENDAGPGGPLTEVELERLPALRREARAGHLADILLFRAGQRLRALVRAAFSPFALKLLLGLAALYVLLGIGFGFTSPVEFTRHVIATGVLAFHWAQHHPDDVWRATRLLAVLAFTALLVALVGMVVRYREARAYVPPPAPARRHEIQNFRERSAFGDASLAEKQQVARALQGQGGFAPHYED